MIDSNLFMKSDFLKKHYFEIVFKIRLMTDPKGMECFFNLFAKQVSYNFFL